MAVANYEQMLRLYVLPTLGRYKVRALYRRQIGSLLASKRQSGLSKNTVRLMRAALSSLLTDAVDDGMILANPCLGIGRKKKAAYKMGTAERHQHVRPMTEERLDKFLETALETEPRVAPLLMVLALAGTRPGEGMALRIGDIDFTGLTLQIERAVNKSGHVGVPKDGDRRMVDLHPRLVPVLKRVARELKEDGLRRGQAWNESAYLFATSTGRPLDLANIEKALKRVLRAMAAPGQDPPRHVLYNLRHTFATTLLAKGVPVTYVSSQLGHSNASTTFKHYAHWLPRPDRRYVDQLLAPDGPTWVVGSRRARDH